MITEQKKGEQTKDPRKDAGKSGQQQQGMGQQPGTGQREQNRGQQQPNRENQPEPGRK